MQRPIYDQKMWASVQPVVADNVKLLMNFTEFLLDENVKLSRNMTELGRKVDESQKQMPMLNSSSQQQPQQGSLKILSEKIAHIYSIESTHESKLLKLEKSVMNYVEDQVKQVQAMMSQQYKEQQASMSEKMLEIKRLFEKNQKDMKEAFTNYDKTLATFEKQIETLGNHLQATSSFMNNQIVELRASLEEKVDRCDKHGEELGRHMREELEGFDINVKTLLVQIQKSESMCKTCDEQIVNITQQLISQQNSLKQLRELQEDKLQQFQNNLHSYDASIQKNTNDTAANSAVLENIDHRFSSIQKSQRETILSLSETLQNQINVLNKQVRVVDNADMEASLKRSESFIQEAQSTSISLETKFREFMRTVNSKLMESQSIVSRDMNAVRQQLNLLQKQVPKQTSFAQKSEQESQEEAEGEMEPETVSPPITEASRATTGYRSTRQQLATQQVDKGLTLNEKIAIVQKRKELLLQQQKQKTKEVDEEKRFILINQKITMLSQQIMELREKLLKLSRMKHTVKVDNADAETQVSMRRPEMLIGFTGENQISCGKIK